MGVAGRAKKPATACFLSAPDDPVTGPARAGIPNATHPPQREKTMNVTDNPAIEIVDFETGAIVVCDTLAHCLACDDGLREEETEIRAALWRGEFYTVGGGAAACYIIRPAAVGAITNRA